MNLYNKQDLQAQQQVMDVAGDTYVVLRKTFDKYNNYGRPIIRETKETVVGTLIPQTKNLNLNTNGHGKWIPTTFKFVCVLPYYISLDDILETEYGNLVVTSIDDMSNYGNITANLTRIDSIERIRNKGE